MIMARVFCFIYESFFLSHELLSLAFGIWREILIIRRRHALFFYKTIALFYFLIFRTRLYDNTHLLNIMFAATQQIASVAGLKATKVQVRRFASQRSGDDFERFCPPPFFLNRIR